MNLKKLFTFAFMLTIGFSVFFPHGTSAAFNQNNIIDDLVFNNSTTMNAGQIDSFLNSLPTSCISPASGFDARLPTGYSPSGGFTFGNFVTAGQVIATAAQVYSINPQVLLATLQKEQSLVAGGSGFCNNGDENKYAAAVGYGCPDGGTVYNWSSVSLYRRGGVEHTTTGSTCVNSASKAGFSQQVIRGAWLLKFGQQRSQGNVGWAVIGGPWDNSDDPQSCYGGPVTQGYRQVCPSGATTYYDGYKTIDGVAVHMDTGATAALYWYTPHFHGNQSFVSIYENWFGSTQVAGKWLRQDPSGQVWLVADGLMPDGSYAKKRFRIPSWDIFIAYHLQYEPVVPVSNEYLSQYTDDGTLGTIASGRSYQQFQFMDNGTRFYIPNDATPCAKLGDNTTPNPNTTWGLDCFNTNVVKTIPGQEFLERLTGLGTLPATIAYNNAVYTLRGGKKQPILDAQTFTDLGLSWANVMWPQAINAGQPLGPLQISHQVAIQFTPTSPVVLYEPATFQFHVIPNYDIFTAWGLQAGAILHPPDSTYTSSPPANSTPDLTIWASDGGGHKYMIDQGRKIDVSSSTNMPGVSWLTIGKDSLGKLQTAVNGSYVWVQSNGTVYSIDAGQKRLVPSWDDFVGLGLNIPQLLPISTYTAGQFPDGAYKLADGASFEYSSGIWVVNGAQKLHIPSWSYYTYFSLDPSKRVTGQSNLGGAYSGTTDMSILVQDGIGRKFVMQNGTRLSIDASTMASWGLTNSNFLQLSDNILNRLPVVGSFGQFIYSPNFGLTYGSGSQRHHIQSYSTYQALGGNPSNTFIVDDGFFSVSPAGTTLP